MSPTDCQSDCVQVPFTASGDALALAGREPFGIGGRRLCFIHPDDPSKCVKVLRTDKPLSNRYKGKKRIVPAWMRRSYDNNRHERAELSALERRLGPPAYEHLPRCYGTVATDLGTGLVLDLIRDADGQISRDLREIIRMRGDLTALRGAFETFGRYLAQHRILTRNLLDHNLVVQACADGSRKIYLIDGFGDPAWVPIARWIPTLARKKIARRLRDAWRRFEAFAQTGEQGMSRKDCAQDGPGCDTLPGRAGKGGA